MAHLIDFSGDSKVEVSGQLTSVPNNHVAKCMYYLSCVYTLIHDDDDDDDDDDDTQWKKYTNYKNYWLLTPYERLRLFLLCAALNPNEYENQVFFENDALTGPNCGNQFYKITTVGHRMLAANSILIAGQYRTVRNIMTYKRIWMQRNYYEPMRQLEFEIRQQQMTQRISTPTCVLS